MERNGDLTFDKDGIYEVLLGTNGVKPIIRPIGIIKKGEKLTAKIYKGTLTFRNLQLNEICSINFTEPENFWYSFRDEVPFTLYIGVPVLQKYLIARCSILIPDKDPVEVEVDVIEAKKPPNPWEVKRRGDGLLLDLLVNFSRVNIYSGAELDRLLTIIEYEIGVIEKTSPELSKITSEIRRAIESKGYKLR